MAARVDADNARIIAIDLDTSGIVRWSPDVEHERNVAIFDLLECNRFEPVQPLCGPYRVTLSLRGSTLHFDVRSAVDGGGQIAVRFPVRPLRRVIRDYFMICESYLKAIKGAAPSRIEAIDMARRGLHNDGAEQLREALKRRVRLDDNTARRLFTLVCVLHVRG